MATASFPDRVLTVTSPMCFGGEDKNQDRVRWCASTRTAGICDGVTSSPFAADAAEMVAEFTPALFQGSIEDRLHAISDLLVARRLEAQSTEFHPPANTSSAMSEMFSPDIRSLSTLIR